MKKTLLMALLMGHVYVQAQNVGIGTLQPQGKLHVTQVGQDPGLVMENLNPLFDTRSSGIYFAYNLQAGADSGRYTGAIKSVATSTAAARLGLFTGGSFNHTALQERLTITNTGLVGINTSEPDYRLDVNGSLRVTSIAKFENNITAEAAITTFGKGIIRNQQGAGQLKYSTFLAPFVATINPFSSLVSAIGFSGFTKAPQVFVCGINGTPAAGDEYFKIQLIPFNVTANGCSVRLYNCSDTQSVFNASWVIVAIGE